MEEKRVKLSIIIVNWNTAKLLVDCLKSLEFEIRNSKFETEIIVVDNGSTDGSVDYINGLTDSKINGLRLEIIKNKENLGYAKGNNIGIKQAGGDYIMLLNSDAIVKEGVIEKLVNFLDKHPEVDVVGPKLLNQDGTPQPNCGKFPSLPVVTVMLFKEHFGGSDYVRCSPRKSGFVDWLVGAAFMARKKVFERIGGLDENLFMYMEEVEWFYRAAKVGFRTYFLEEAEIIHLGRGSSKTGKVEPILNIYRGIIYFYKKHKALPELLILMFILKSKAFLALILGYLKNDNYLKQTYGQALKIS